MTVTVTNVATNLASPTVTDERGYYQVRYLISGTYSVEAGSYTERLHYANSDDLRWLIGQDQKFTWKVEDVWARIKASGVEHHKAYDLGMSRLSCCFCVFAPIMFGNPCPICVITWWVM